MIIKQYQELMSLNTGSTTYETDVCGVLNIPLNKSIAEIKADISKALQIHISEYKKKLKIKSKWFMSEEDMLECTYEQFVELDRILAEGDNIKNLHKLIGIYFRPRHFSFKKLRYVVKPFDLRRQDTISEQILDMNMEDANGLILFFYQIAMKSFQNMKICYLNQMKQETNTYIANQLET